MFVGLHFIPFGFPHPQQLLEYSSVISLQAAPQRSVLSCSLAAAPLSLSPQISIPSSCVIQKKHANMPLSSASTSFPCSVTVLLSFPEAHLYSISLMPAGPLYQWAMVTVSLFLSNLSLCLSLPVCNKTLGPAVALIELWDHISAALEELDRLSMALCCRPGSH